MCGPRPLAVTPVADPGGAKTTLLEATTSFATRRFEELTHPQAASGAGA